MITLIMLRTLIIITMNDDDNVSATITDTIVDNVSKVTNTMDTGLASQSVPPPRPVNTSGPLRVGII